MLYNNKMKEIIITIDYEMFLRLIIAAILGLLMGLERELKRKSLGLKTILVISIVSCLLTIVSIQSAYIFEDSAFIDIRMDPLRLAAQIVSGVGFLGAGVILRREDDTVSGLTTAAIVWGAAGIGVATGAGFYAEAITGVILLLVSIEIVPVLIKRLKIKNLHLNEFFLQMTLKNQEDVEEMIRKLKKEYIEVKDIQIKNINGDKHFLSVAVLAEDSLEALEIYHDILKTAEIITVEVYS